MSREKFARNGGVAINKMRARAGGGRKCIGRSSKSAVARARARFIGCFSLDVEFE